MVGQRQWEWRANEVLLTAPLCHSPTDTALPRPTKSGLKRLGFAVDPILPLYHQAASTLHRVSPWRYPHQACPTLLLLALTPYKPSQRTSQPNLGFRPVTPSIVVTARAIPPTQVALLCLWKGDLKDAYAVLDHTPDNPDDFFLAKDGGLTGTYSSPPSSFLLCIDADVPPC